MIKAQELIIAYGVIYLAYLAHFKPLVKADRDRYRVMQNLSITAQSLDESYQAISGSLITLRIEYF